jgi:hypothetical protein
MTEEQKKYLIDLNGMLFFKSEQDKENLEKFIKKDDALNSLGAISYLVKQNLTESQKAQARENIGAAAPGEGGGGSSENEIIVINGIFTDGTDFTDSMNFTITEGDVEIINNYTGRKPMYLSTPVGCVPFVGLQYGYATFYITAGTFSFSGIVNLETREGLTQLTEDILSTIVDDNGKIKTSALPDLGFYDDVVEGYLNPKDNLFYKSWKLNNLVSPPTDIYEAPITGESGKIYLDLHTNNTYRWSGSVYVRINPDEYAIATNEQILALFN